MSGKFKRKSRRKNNESGGLSLHVVPFSEIQSLGIAERVRKILSLILQNKIIILHGRLRPEEEARLIEDTMAMVDHLDKFKGIELAVMEPDLKNKGIILKMKHGIAKRLIGDTRTLTIIGPASAVKEIKQDFRKLELMIK